MIERIVENLSPKNSVRNRKILMGKENFITARIIYIEGITDPYVVEELIIRPLMFDVDETILPKDNRLEFICEKYMVRGNTHINTDENKLIVAINDGSVGIFIEGESGFIVVAARSSDYRAIAEPSNESTIRGSREGFTENFELNLAMIKRYLKDKNLITEIIKIGERSKSDLVLFYIEDIADEKLVDEVRNRINQINIDSVSATGQIEQLIEDSTYSLFPQAFGSEKPDRIVSKILEGRVGIILSGTPYVITVPAILTEFFQAPEDYYQRTIVASFIRFTRLVASFIVIFLTPLYLTLINYNVELIPVAFITPIVESRQGIPFPPFFEILFMEIVVELLREGGLRLPPRIAQTISLVGGIIIGNAAIDARVISPTTMLIVGVSTIASFVIANYEMSTTIRFIRLPMLLLADSLGFLGIAIGYFFLIAHVFSLTSITVPYLTFTKHDMQDTFIRSPIWSMKTRSNSFPIKDRKRMDD